MAWNVLRAMFMAGESGTGEVRRRSDTDQIRAVSGFDRWLKVTKELGFPIVLAGVLLYSHFTVMQKIVTALERNNIVVERVERVLWRVAPKVGVEPEGSLRNP